jgi:hypothetical protein
MDPVRRHTRRSRRWLVLVAVVVLAGVGAAVGWRFLSTDSGVAACRTIAARMIATDNGQPWPLDRNARADFAGSRYAGLRTAGTTIVDFLVEADRTGFSAPTFEDTLVTDYTNLSAACARHGVTMPPLGFPGD